MRTLTGGSGTIIFPPFDPNQAPYNANGDARALNNSGQVTGAALGMAPTYDDLKPYRWAPGSSAVQIQGTLVGSAFGLDINSAGVIAGYTQNGATGIRGFRAVGTSAVILDAFPGTNIDGFTRAVAINASGQIAGSASNGTSPMHAVLWNSSNAIQDLGTLGGTTSAAIDINDAGQVIGTSTLPGDATTHFFLWSAGTGMQDISPVLGTATSILAINSSGQIVGTYGVSNAQSHAFLYTPGSGVRDLGTLGGASSSPTGLNNLGQVVGSSVTSGGTTHAFLWTPSDGMEDVTAITGFAAITALNDRLQTLTTNTSSGSGPNGPQLVQLTVTASNQPPVASFTVSCPALQCTFDASSSSDDAGVVKYSWSWGNGRSESHSTPVTKNTYAAAGRYNVTLTVTDAGGLTNAITKAVQVPTPPPNQPPAVTISAPANGALFTQGTSVTFTGSANDPEDGALSGASLVWTSNRDGQIGTGTSFSTSTLSVGTHAITLTATDSKGAKSAAAIQVVIDPPPPSQPVAAIGSYTCNNQAYPHQCSFDASASSDDKGIVSYKWNWGNGRSETKTVPTVRNTWASAGTYLVTLTVTDTDGLTGSTQISVNVP
jgi:probable HAF family extracellular repeat protein